MAVRRSIFDDSDGHHDRCWRPGEIGLSRTEARYVLLQWKMRNTREERLVVCRASSLSGVKYDRPGVQRRSHLNRYCSELLVLMPRSSSVDTPFFEAFNPA